MMTAFHKEVAVYAVFCRSR